MLTIKIRFPSGNENLFPARRVEWIEEETVGHDGHPPNQPGVLVYYDDGSCSHYGRTEEQRTMVWVMNQEGATVATYRL